MKGGHKNKSEPLEQLGGACQTGSKSALSLTRRRIRPLRLMMGTELSIFVVEVIVILIFSVLPSFSVVVEAFLGGVLLTLLVLPSMYVLSLRPLIVNIAERTQAEQSLRRTEERYRMLFEGVLDPVFVADAETGILLDCNSAGTRLVGREKSELIGQSHTILHPPQENEGEFAATFKQHLGEKQGQTLDTQVVTKAGEIREVAIKASLLEIRGKKVLLGVFRDTTQRKEVDVALRKSEERFKQVVENAGDWIWEVNAEGLYTYVSPIIESVLGYRPEEIVGKKHFYDFFAPDVKEELKRAAFEAFTKKESFKCFVNPNVHKNGSTVILETSGTPIIDEKGNLCGYRGADRDITERQQRENELRKLNADLVLSSRRAGTAEVATDILHNVGNVLNSINVSANYIEDKVLNSRVPNLKKVIDILTEHSGDLGTFLTEDERGKCIPLYLKEVVGFILGEQKAIAEKLRSLTKNVEHVKQIIKAQQSYARSGGMEVFMSIQEVIEDAVEINHAALKRHGIDLKYELAGLPKIRMDKQRILQILVNLIANAKQALSESGEQEKVLTIRSYKHGEDKLRVEVADNGVGISKENMPKIFTHGFTTKKRGHGFGLHSSFSAAREMGGALTVYSDGPGHGATFTLELPLIKSEAITDGCSK